MFCSFSQVLRRFRRDEDGALIVFGLMLFVLMVMLGGFAVDLMRYENTRVNLQNTLDRSTLAAAALGQKLDREGVVRDYMEKAGLGDQLAKVTVTSGQNATSVSATGIADTKPLFMHMLGIDHFDAAGRSKAEQSISNLEIVLVLDVSGSMSGTKIANLKIAAKAFVDTILDNDPNHRASISIVPYNAQVNIGPDLVSKFNITHKNLVANNNCIEIPASAFGSLALSQTDPLPMMAYADIAYATNRINGFVSLSDATYAKPNYASTFCKTSTVNVVRLPNNDRTVLKSQIDALQAGGNTSITLGMKWGATLIDPSMRPVYTDFINNGKIPANIPSRPFDYTDTNAMKIIVLMTDGEHVAHNRVTNAYKSGPSPILRSVGDGNYSIRFVTGRPAIAGTNEFYVPHLGTWQATAWDYNGKGTIIQDWRDIWANLKMTYVAWQFYARALGTDSTTRNAVYTSVLDGTPTQPGMKAIYAQVPAMDTSLDQTCDLVKSSGVVVYGVTVEAPTHGQEVIRSCASSNQHYFEATAANVTEKFQAIASNITMLKLTQ